MFCKNQRMMRKQKVAEELEFRRVVDQVKLESESVEPLLDSYFGYSTETIALLLTPIVQILLLLTDASPLHSYQVTLIPATYGITPASSSPLS